MSNQSLLAENNPASFHYHDKSKVHIKIINTTAVDAMLRDQQAGFRKDRSCTDQIATLRIIIELTIEWNTSVYVNFVDYEKAFNRLDI